jgi:hypothetical protein
MPGLVMRRLVSRRQGPEALLGLGGLGGRRGFSGGGGGWGARGGGGGGGGLPGKAAGIFGGPPMLAMTGIAGQAWILR